MIEICIVKDDIVNMDTDAIVNAANTSLRGGSGVDGAIHRAAGPELLKECITLNGCKVGKAKITKGYKLKAKYVIHTVGPIWRGGIFNEADLLAESYRSCLELAEKENIRSIAFPSISTGVFGYPAGKAAEIAVKEVMEFCSKHMESFEKIIFVCFDDFMYGIYEKILSRYVDKL